VDGPTDKIEGVSLRVWLKSKRCIQMFCCHWSGTRISGDAETGFDNTRTAATVIRSLIEKDIEIRVVQPMNARSLCRIR